jgi:nitrogen fixation protein
MIHNKISLPYKVGPIKLMVKGVTMCKDSMEFYFLFFHVKYHEKNQKIYINIHFKKTECPLIVSKNETLTGGSIMFFETPTLHISKIMPICLLNILLKFN